MKVNKKPKIISTAYRVLRLMLLLNNTSYSADELNMIFSKDPNIARGFSKEVILKYITTLRLAGYKICKPSPANNHTYKLVKAPINIRLNDSDIKSLAVLETHVLSLYQEKLQKHFESVIDKISRYLSDDQAEILNSLRNKHKKEMEDLRSKYSEYAYLIKKFERYCIEDQRVSIKYKFHCDNEEKQIALEPKSLKYDSTGVYIAGYNTITGEKQLLNLNNIQEVKQLPVKSKHSYVLSPVVFKLSGRVARGYRLYEDEKIMETNPDEGTTTLAAYVDDRTLLIQRLLKYGDFCEIIYPKNVREKMISIIQDTLKNYEAV